MRPYPLTKSSEKYGFDHIYWKISLMENVIFCAVFKTCEGSIIFLRGAVIQEIPPLFLLSSLISYTNLMAPIDSTND